MSAIVDDRRSLRRRSGAETVYSNQTFAKRPEHSKVWINCVQVIAFILSNVLSTTSTMDITNVLHRKYKIYCDMYLNFHTR